MPTKIEWVRNPDGTQGETWNPIIGCSPVSDGCKHCYASRIANKKIMRKYFPGLTDGAQWNGKTLFRPERLEQPFHWRKPRGIFVCSMSDLFHESVAYEQVLSIFGVMAKTLHHKYYILTKRPKIALDRYRYMCFESAAYGCTIFKNSGWPLPNVTLGVSVEDQKTYEQRWDICYNVPASKHFISYEPAIGPINERDLLSIFHCPDWVIMGSETGPGARPMDLDWARSVRDQCNESGIPFFFKKDSQGRRELDGRIWEEMPR